MYEIMINFRLGFQVTLLFIIFGLLVQGGTNGYLNTLEKNKVASELIKKKALVNELNIAKKQFVALAGKTITLAKEGNENAVRIVEQFRAAGVDFDKLVQPQKR